MTSARASLLGRAAADPELCVHVIVVGVAVHAVLGVLKDITHRHEPDLFGVAGGVDLSDAQWSSFRKGLPQLVPAMAGFVAVSRLARLAGVRCHEVLYAAAGVGFAGFLHGASAVYPLAIAAAVHALVAGMNACCVPRRGAVAVVWVAVLSALFVADAYGGFARRPPPGLEGWYTRGVKSVFRAYPGVYRWHVGFNLTALRLISYAVDSIEAHNSGAVGDGSPAPPARCPALSGGEAAYAVRQDTPRSVGEYTLVGLLGYTFYPPLLIAGPITTYNAFRSHLAAPQRAFTTAYVAGYAARFLVCLALLEGGTRAFHVWAIAAAPPVRDALSPTELLCLGLGLLNALWLKFAVIWRFARFVALGDGVEVPENMTRCLQNNVHSIAGFWRNWHRSFNKWIVRYLYVPLGGRAWRNWNVFIVFLFVAAWHDLELRLVKWALLMAVCSVPEALLARAFPAPAPRRLRVAGGAVSNTVLMAANLIGFGWLGGGGGAAVMASPAALAEAAAAAFVLFYSTTYIALAVREGDGAGKLE